MNSILITSHFKDIHLLLGFDESLNSDVALLGSHASTRISYHFPKCFIEIENDNAYKTSSGLTFQVSFSVQTKL